MVVVAAAVCTRSGKILMGRAYVEVARARLEGLLAAFPKLLPADSQHTFVETDAVRYVYQPLEQLFVLMVTTKSSNILEDLETLHLLAKLVPEYCKSAKEDDVMRNVFELIFAFDEVLQPLGVREKLNMGQVKTFMEMESHEEKIFEMVEKNKQREAKEQAKLRQAQIDRERQDAAKAGRSPGFGSGGAGPRPTPGGDTAYVVRPSPSEQRAHPPPAAAAASAHKPGLDLKKGPSKTDAFLKQLGIQDVPAAAAAPVAKSAGASLPPPVATAPVHLTFDEKLMLTMSRDGALEQMEIKGDLYVTIASADKGLVTIKLAPVDQRVWKFSTHPKINKQAFASDLLLTLADNTKPFPAGNALGVVKWRVGGKDEALVPVRVSCWVTPSPTSTSVSLEYELLASGMELRNFAVTMQVPGAAPPVFEGSNEGAAFNAKQRTLTWTLPLVDASNGSATLDFTVNGTIEQAAFFPIRVNFASPNTLCPLHVQEVVPVAGGAPQKFSVASSLTVEQYDII